MKLHLCLFIVIVGCLLTISVKNVEASIQCYDCHGTSIPVDFRPLDAATRDEDSGGFQGNHRTHIAAPATPTNCAVCHPGSSSYTPSHRDGDITLSSRLNNSPLTTLYRNFTSAWRQTSSPILGSCSNVNCHFETLTPAWGDPPFSTTSQCNKCHGGAVALSATHAVHQRYSTGLMGKFSSYAACASCHVNYASPPSFSHATSAGKRPITVSVGNYNSGSLTYLPSQNHGAFGSCADLYCHSPGNRGTTPFTPPIQAATWEENLRTDCSGCHKGNYTSFRKMSSGSHAKHVFLFNRIDCVKCHSGTVNKGLSLKDLSYHVNGAVDISYNNSSTAVNGTYNGSVSPVSKTPGTPYGTCTNVYCHSNGQNNGGTGITYTQPTWGNSATGRCGQCHEVLASHNFSGNEISSGSHSPHLSYNSMTASNAVKCTQCHNWNGQPFNPSCTDQCHSSISSKHVNHQIDIMIPSHFGPNARYDGAFTPGNGYSTCTAVYCHSNGTSVTTGSVPGAVSPSWGSGAMQCNGCHGNKTFPDYRRALPLYTSNRPTTKANSHLAHGIRELTCSQCHFGVTTDNTSIASKTLHVNRLYNVLKDNSVSFTYTFKTNGSTCASISCHGNTGATWGSAACLDCHAVAQGARAAVTGQFASNSHHVQGTITNAHCYQCHWEARSDGTINQTYHSGAAASGSAVDLVVYGAGIRPASYNPGTFVTYTANGTRSQIQKISSHCLGCHSDQNNNATPFGDGKTPRQYAWDNSSVDARYSQSGTTTWGKYVAVTNAAKKNVAKAFSAHGNANANKRGWSSTTGVDGTITDTSGAVGVQCYDCHNSHGSTVSGITSRYSSATGRQKGGILKDTVRGFGGYSANYRPTSGGSEANKNIRNPGASLCIDCHLSSTPKQALAFRGYTTPWGYNSTYGASQAIIGYFDSPYMAPGTAGPQVRYPYKNLNKNAGGHFGASSELSVPAMATIDGLCTPCHDPHGASLADPQYSVPLLKGTWVTSPYKEDAAPAGNSWKSIIYEPTLYSIDQNTFGSDIRTTVAGMTQSPDQSSGLCLGCHPKSSLTDGVTHTWKSKDRIHESVKGWKTANATVKHNFSCSKCHSAHNGSVLPRLMVTNCLNSSHKGRTKYNPTPVISGASGDEGGSGSGRIPGSYEGYGWESGPGDKRVTCHESPTANGGSGLDQSWNEVTPWVPPPSITSGPSAGSLFAWESNIQTTITWATNELSTSYVDYGTTTGYGLTAGNATSVLNHSVQLSGLTNHSTYNYRVRSGNPGGEAVSGNNSFSISLPPTVPVLTTRNGTLCSGTCSILLNFNSTDPDGGTIQYEIEVDTSTLFNTVNKQTTTTTANSWTPSLASNKTWYWRARARDLAYLTDPPSAWSSTSSFVMSDKITSGPAAGALTATGTDVQSTITWATDVFSTSAVDHGLTTAYGLNSTDATSVKNHSVTIHNLTNHNTNHYRVRFADSYGNEIISGDYTVFADLPPSNPTVIARDSDTCATSCAETVSWNTSTDPDGGAVEYQVQVDTATSFNSGNLQTSSWLAHPTNTWSPTLATNATWYYRVKARDATNGNVETAWSPYRSFSMSSTAPPPAPVLTTYAGCGSGVCSTTCAASLAWSAVTSPDGDPVQYYVQLTTDSTFASVPYNTGWIAGTSWNPTPQLAGGNWYWRVMARDSVHTSAMSAYSLPSSFTASNQYDTCGCYGCYDDSCPFVFAWDGNKYSYVTDIAGPVIGLPKNIGADGKEIHLLGHKLYQPSYIDLKALKPDNDGDYRIKLREPLAEMVYVDEMKLLEVDYPQGYEILNSTSELTYRYGYVNPFRIYTIKDPHQPLSAIDKDGRDILAAVLKVDNNTAPAERDDLEYYTFDFGTVRNPAAAKLIIDGWTVFGPKYKKINVKQAVQPYLEVVDKNGTWVKAKSFGEPAGDLKRMVIDIADIFRSDDHRIRLHRGMRKEARWLIDRIMLDDSAPVPVKSRETSAIKADLLHGGNLPYDHVNLDHRMAAEDSVVPDDPSAYGTGRFTRYGDVRELIATTDDRFVLMRHGDDIELTFPGSAPPEKGIQRGFMLKTKLYYKPVRGSRNIEPLPFSGMGIYPYDESEESPRDQKHQDYRNFYNTREYRAHSLTSMLNEMWGLHEAQAGSIEAVPATIAVNLEKSQQSVNGQETGLVETGRSEPEVRLSLWQWLGNITSKVLLSITAVLVWLKSLVGL